MAKQLIAGLRGDANYDKSQHKEEINKVREERRKKVQKRDEASLKQSLETFPPETRRCIERARDFKISAKQKLEMSADEFRYNRQMKRLPRWCDGCGMAFSETHGLDCRKGGLVNTRHNEVRDLFKDLAKVAFETVTVEHPLSNPHQPEERDLMASEESGAPKQTHFWMLVS
eukprot:GHVR01043667.1.p3 GENE.GHVR01043667.1~~GHVR01043667.1.p3  ORF type:complete len:172 (+),score=26.34 GHVR01043667.1:1777-2292(+)